MCAMLNMFRHWAIPEKIQTERLKIYFSQPPPNPANPIHGILWFLILPLEIPVKISFSSPLEILWNCVTPSPLENSKVRNQERLKFYMIFSWTPLEIPVASFLLDPLPHVYEVTITICSLCTDIDIPILKYLARYTGLNDIFNWIPQLHTVQLLGHSRKIQITRWV